MFRTLGRPLAVLLALTSVVSVGFVACARSPDAAPEPNEPTPIAGANPAPATTSTAFGAGPTATASLPSSLATAASGATATPPPSAATARPTPAATATQSTPASGPAAPGEDDDALRSGRIALASLDGGIYTVLRNGAGAKLLAEPRGTPDTLGFRGAYAWPVWSPDGKTILYSALLPDGRRGLDISLRTVPARGGEETIVYKDDPATSGIGSGVAHYAYWSPDSRRVALIAGTASGLTGTVINVSNGNQEAILASGAPIYYAWASDSRRILVHHEEFLRLYEFDSSGGSVGSPRQIGKAGSDKYNAPAFSPRGDRLLYGENSSSGTSVYTTGFDGAPPVLLLSTQGRAAFGWSPEGRRLAILSDEVDGLFTRLTLMSSGGRELFRVARSSMISFWWSPDGNRLALTSVGEDENGDRHVEVTVVDVRDQSEALVATLLPSDEFLFMQLYFDQFAHSLRIWSPDSRFLVLFGTLGERVAQNASGGPAQSNERGTAWVVDTTGALEPVAVGSAYIGSWSPG